MVQRAALSHIPHLRHLSCEYQTLASSLLHRTPLDYCPVYLLSLPPKSEYFRCEKASLPSPISHFIPVVSIEIDCSTPVPPISFSCLEFTPLIHSIVLFKRTPMLTVIKTIDPWLPYPLTSFTLRDSRQDSPLRPSQVDNCVCTKPFSPVFSCSLVRCLYCFTSVLFKFEPKSCLLSVSSSYSILIFCP